MPYVYLSSTHVSMLCVLAPPLTEVLRYSASNLINTQRNNVQFLPGADTYEGNCVLGKFFTALLLCACILEV